MASSGLGEAGRAGRGSPSITPISALMFADEVRAGLQPIFPHNSPPWFDPSDWNGWPVLSIGRGELHIVAVWSARKGALSRLIAGAKSAGLSPVIVCPVGPDMPAIVKRWGWKETVVGDGWDRREEWCPSA